MTIHESDSSGWLEVANVDEIPLGTMKHVEVNDREIAIANVNGKFYAIDDRCGHASARLSSGGLRGNIVTCPLHGAQFDVTSGKKQSEARLGGSIPDMDKLPQSFLKRIEHSAKIVGEIKTYDQRSYEVSIDGKSIKLKVKS
ncbi:MAG: Rieske 2Fe-2S domain-containing protein [Candidatus Bathyarchaeia archaeon]